MSLKRKPKKVIKDFKVGRDELTAKEGKKRNKGEKPLCFLKLEYLDTRN